MKYRLPQSDGTWPVEASWPFLLSLQLCASFFYLAAASPFFTFIPFAASVFHHYNVFAFHDAYPEKGDVSEDESDGKPADSDIDSDASDADPLELKQVLNKLILVLGS